MEFADFLILSGNFGTEAGANEGDIDCNGKVEFADFLVLAGNFGQDVDGTAAIPEPRGFLLFAFGMVALGRARHHRRA